jgi:glucokinase
LAKFYAAVDLGATNVRVGVGDTKGISNILSEPTDKSMGAQGIISQIIRMLKALPIKKFTSMGIGTIGPIDLDNGCIVNTPNLPFKIIPLIEPLQKEFDVKVAMLNDCSTAVLGERDYGAGIGIDNIVYVTLSTGIGGGALVDGHLLLGKDGNAVEIGHVMIDSSSPLVCGCGAKGHWEAYCSGNNIPNLARLMLAVYKGKTIIMQLARGDPNMITSEMVFQACKMGDPAAMKIVSKIGEVNAIGFSNIVNIFDPKLVTVGGSIALKNSELILNPINKRINDYLINRKPKIILTPLGSDAVLLGALSLARSI